MKNINALYRLKLFIETEKSIKKDYYYFSVLMGFLILVGFFGALQIDLIHSPEQFKSMMKYAMFTALGLVFFMSLFFNDDIKSAKKLKISKKKCKSLTVKEVLSDYKYVISYRNKIISKNRNLYEMVVKHFIFLILLMGIIIFDVYSYEFQVELKIFALLVGIANIFTTLNVSKKIKEAYSELIIDFNNKIWKNDAYIDMHKEMSSVSVNNISDFLIFQEKKYKYDKKRAKEILFN